MVLIGALVAELQVRKDCGNPIFKTLSGFIDPKAPRFARRFWVVSLLCIWALIKGQLLRKGQLVGCKHAEVRKPGQPAPFTCVLDRILSILAFRITSSLLSSTWDPALATPPRKVSDK